MKTIYNNIIATILVLFMTNSTFSQCWSKIDAGSNHTVAIATNGTLWTWGSNSNGQLGDGTLISKNIPIQIGLANNWIAVQAGDRCTIALRSSGILGNSGTLWAWGSNFYGQLGDSTFDDKLEPIQIGTNTKWTQISIRSNHVMAINDTSTIFVSGNKTLWGWGNNFIGQLGNGITAVQNSPIQIGTAIDWNKVSAGENYSIAQKIDGRLFGWGANYYGQLGLNSTIATTIRTQIGTDSDWSANFTTSGSHTLAIKNNGTLWAWGANSAGQLGTGTTATSLVPLQIGTNIDWDQVAGGFDHTIALKTNANGSAVYTWGKNNDGQLGIGNNIDALVRTLVAYNGATISAAGNTGFMLKSDGTLFSFGKNGDGQLGDGTFNNSNSPIQVVCSSILAVNNQQNIDNELILSPNPTSDFLNITTAQHSKIDLVKIIDLIGKAIVAEIENSNQINVTKLQKGIYIAEMTIDGTLYQQKFVKN